MDDKNFIQRLAFAHAKGLGPVHGRELLCRAGSVEAVFAMGEAELVELGLNKNVARDLLSSENWDFAAKEWRYLKANGAEVVFLGDKKYPLRLRECPDAPVMLIYKGNCPLNSPKMLAVVGTRHPSSQGRTFTHDMVTELAKRHPDLVIVSGLAYGIDVTAHNAALEAGIATIGVMTTGFDKVYPKEHLNVARAVVKQGALVGEQFRGSKMVPGSFVSRNRIIAGLCDGVLVAESPAKGGSLTTADIAVSYSREVFAVPGRPGDVKSAGCNDLIKQNKAALICSAEDVEFQLGWEVGKVEMHKSSTFPELNLDDLTEEERTAMSVIRSAGKIDKTDLALQLKISPNDLAMLLFNMEMRGLVHTLPGNMVGVGRC